MIPLFSNAFHVFFLVVWEHDLFQNNKAKEQEEMTVIDKEDDNMTYSTSDD